MKILLVEDDYAARLSIRKLLEELEHEVKECDNGGTALIELATHHFDLILSDINMPSISGLDLLKTMVNLEPQRKRPVILFTGAGTLDSAIDALRIGAVDYLLKPIKAIELVNAIEKVERNVGLDAHQALDYPLVSSQKPVNSDNENAQLLVFSSVMSDLQKKAEVYHSDRSIPVLIQGETGTGKELIARIIHSGKKVGRAPFIDFNCAAITQSLFESELFGYEPGAFTGGLSKGQKGKFDLARGGTMFLDEIGDLPFEMQGVFLRVLQEKEFYRVGGLKKVPLDARIICATNINMSEAVEKGKFRLDLYHRLNVGEIYIPPLRERKEEIIPLALTFLHNASMRKGKDFSTISPNAERLLLNYDWPGNVRELLNTIEKAVLMYNAKELSAIHLESTINTYAKQERANIQAGDFTKKLNEHVKDLVKITIQKYNGNKTAAAQELGISRGALYRLLARMNINDIE